MIVNGTLSLECLVCSENYKFTRSDTDFESQGEELSSSGGPEIVYTWHEEFECENEECDNEISFEYSAIEFPLGARFDDDIVVDGAKILSRFEIDFEERPEEDEEPDQDEDEYNED